MQNALLYVGIMTENAGIFEETIVLFIFSIILYLPVPQNV